MVEESIVSLMNENGEEFDFIEIAGISYNGNFYNILKPVELLEGMGEDEALVFMRVKTEDGEYKYNIVLDLDVIDAVFAEYEVLLEKIEKEEKTNE